MTKKKAELRLEDILKTDVQEIFNARNRALAIHRSQDISAAGDEVEETMRSVIRRKLGQSYYVGHGHLVETNMNSSSQLDLIIADVSASASLFTGLNGTEYFAANSFYAFAEFKSTYYKSKNYVEHFVGVIEEIEAMPRDEIPGNYLRLGNMGLNFETGGLFSLNRTTERSRLFSFMLFVDAGDFDENQIVKLWEQLKPKTFPSVICLLNRGLVTFMDVAKNGGQSIITFPQLTPIPEGSTRHIAFIDLQKYEDLTGAYCLGGFLLMLFNHLQSTMLMAPSPGEHISHLLKAVETEIRLCGPF